MISVLDAHDRILALAKARRSAATKLPTDVEKTDKRGRKYWGPPDKPKKGATATAATPTTPKAKAKKKPPGHVEPTDWLDGERRYDEDADRAFGLHRELLNNMAATEKDPKKLAKLRAAAAAHAVVGDAFRQAHAAKLAGDHEHADALGRHADEVRGHVSYDAHADVTREAAEAIQGRHGPDARAGSNLTPEADARAQIEAAVGPAPQPKRKPAPAVVTPIVHAARPPKRKTA